jgi:hypothetical protein
MLQAVSIQNARHREYPCFLQTFPPIGLWNMRLALIPVLSQGPIFPLTPDDGKIRKDCSVKMGPRLWTQSVIVHLVVDTNIQIELPQMSPVRAL